MWTYLTIILTIFGVSVPLFVSPIPFLFPSDSAQVRWLPLENKYFTDLQPEQVATQYLKRYTKELNIGSEIQETTFTRRVHQVNDSAIVVQLGQVIHGIEVWGNRLNIVLTSEHQPVGSSGSLTPHVQSPPRVPLTLNRIQKVALTALTTLTGALPIDAKQLTLHTPLERLKESTRYSEISIPWGHKSLKDLYSPTPPLRIKPYWYPTQNGLRQAYYIEIQIATQRSRSTDAYAFLIDAVNGMILSRYSLIQQEHHYRAYTHEDGQPISSPLQGQYQ